MFTVPPQMLLVNSVIMKCHGCVDSNIWSKSVLMCLQCWELFSAWCFSAHWLSVVSICSWKMSCFCSVLISPCVVLHSIPAAYIQFPGLWDCETRSSPRPFPPWRFLHGLQHRAWLFRWWLKLRWAVKNLFFFLLFFISIHNHIFIILFIKMSSKLSMVEVCFTCHVLCFITICTRVRC